MLDSTSAKAATCLVFMPARNCEMYAAAALHSLARQTLRALHVLYVDDNSEDQTGPIARHYLRELFPGRHSYIRNEAQLGKSRNVWQHLRPRAGLGEFIAVLDADDQLLDAQILARMAQSYAAGKDAVWTNYVTDTGRAGGNGPLDPERPPRTQGWRTSHFFSFRAALLAAVPESYFKDDAGAWLMGACDIALALPILDQTRNTEFIPVEAYRYTAGNPLSLHNIDPQASGLSSRLQMRNACQVFAKPPLPLRRQQGTPPETADHPARKDPEMPQTTVPGPAPGNLWQDKAAARLIEACPALLDAQAVTEEPALTPLQLWSLYQIVRQRPGNILHLGSPASAPALAAVADAIPGARLTCLAAATGDAPELRAKLAVAGLDASAWVVATQRKPITLGNLGCDFPAPEPLGTAETHSIVVLDARGGAAEPSFPVIALPVLADTLDPAGFVFCVLTDSLAAARATADAIAGLSPSLSCCPGGIGGTGLVVFPRPEE